MMTKPYSRRLRFHSNQLSNIFRTAVVIVTLQIVCSGSVEAFQQVSNFFKINLPSTIQKNSGVSAMQMVSPPGPFSGMLDSIFSSNKSVAKASTSARSTVVEQFFDAFNRRDINGAVQFFADDCVYENTFFAGEPFRGKSEVKRHMLKVIDGICVKYELEDLVVDINGNKICARWEISLENGDTPPLRGCSFYTLSTNPENGQRMIQTAFDVPEPAFGKPGDVGLNILSAASSVIEKTGFGYLDVSTEVDPGSSVVERYFEAWNRRDMKAAIACFAEDCDYDDAQYPEAFVGKEKLERHLVRVADSLPRSFAFVVDDLTVTKNRRKIGVRWHLENGGEALPFTRGCSFYTTNGNGLIQTGFDVPEPAVIKPGAQILAISSVSSKVMAEPIRVLPLVAWILYIYVVFFSDGILPGANALILEQRTWEEVRDLSINFFLVSPLLHLPFSPVVHPMLEGIFNVLLSWAAMFAGFLSDEREDKPNLLPTLPMVAGMQFLTSAFFLPYLGTRSSEKLELRQVVYKEDLGSIERTLGEFRGLGAVLGGVGTGAIVWSLFGRPEFGDFTERFASLIDLLSIDRVGSSFVVDLVIFGLFQGWLVDDDLKRRGVDINDEGYGALRMIAKYFPFFGLAIYLTARPELPSRSRIED